MAEFMYDRSLNPESQWYLEWVQVRRELDRYYGPPVSQPESVGVTDEELLAVQDQAVASFPPVHPEAEPLSAVEYARELEIRKARAVLKRWGCHVIAPVPASERLPEAADCDAEGRCWWWCPPDWIELRKHENAEAAFVAGATHWLPYWALLLPKLDWSRGSYAPKPIPVSEQLPGPEHCCGNPRNGEGLWCWGREFPKTAAGTPVVWRLMPIECLPYEAVDWLPYWALPLPKLPIEKP